MLACSMQTAAAKDIGVTLDGKTLTFATAPCLDNGRVLVPMRGVLESLGYSVEWQNATKSVLATKSETSILMPLGSTQVKVNGKSVSVDAPAKLISGHTLVPLRFLAEYSGAEVVWDNAAKTVNITSKNTASTATPAVPEVKPAVSEPKAEVPAEKTFRDSLVHVHNGNKNGVAVVLSEDGLLATSYTLIKESTSLKLTFYNGKVYQGDIRVVGLDAEKDVVLLKLEENDLYPIKTSTKYKKDQSVFSLSVNPGGKYGALNGKIHGVASGIMVAGIGAGAGNALFNENNEVIGLSTFYLTGSMHRASIPISDVKAIKQNLSMSVEELRAHVYKPTAIKNLEYSKSNNYYPLFWTPINGAEAYIVSETKYSDGSCPWIPAKETTEGRLPSWQVSGNYGVVLTSSYSHTDIKVKAVVDGKETPWSKTITIRN